MPIHSWNWFRAVGVGNDLKSWYGDNPQVEDGREGGNQEFDDDVSGQYEDEVNFMMRRLRLNFYRAEDMLLIYKRKQWAEEDAEFKKEQDRRKKEKKERMIKKNKERRLKREQEEARAEADRQGAEDDRLRRLLAPLLRCPGCGAVMAAPVQIFQCRDGRIICGGCRDSGTREIEVIGRNPAMERIAASVFPAQEPVTRPSAPREEETASAISIVGESEA